MLSRLASVLLSYALRFHGYYLAFFAIAEIILYIYKTSVFFYQPKALAEELVILALWVAIDYGRLFFSLIAILTGTLSVKVSSLVLLLPSILGSIHIFTTQAYVLLIDSTMINILHKVSTSMCISDYSEFTALIVCVGVGNVSQLACDLLIYNCGFQLASNVHFKYIPSAVGSDPYGETCTSKNIATCCQLYINKEKHLVVLQSRSPPFPGFRKKHVREIVDFLSAMNVSRIILLSNSFGSQRNDSELTGAQLRYTVAGQADTDDITRLEALHLKRLSPQREKDLIELGIPKPTTTFYLPGGGLSSLLFDELACQVQKPVFLLNLFTSEGDNASDAVSVAWTVSEWLGLSKTVRGGNMPVENQPASGWRAPTSWKMLYGSETVGSLY